MLRVDVIAFVTYAILNQPMNLLRSVVLVEKIKETFQDLELETYLILPGECFRSTTTQRVYDHYAFLTDKFTNIIPLDVDSHHSSSQVERFQLKAMKLSMPFSKMIFVDARAEPTQAFLDYLLYETQSLKSGCAIHLPHNRTLDTFSVMIIDSDADISMSLPLQPTKSWSQFDVRIFDHMKPTSNSRILMKTFLDRNYQQPSCKMLFATIYDRVQRDDVDRDNDADQDTPPPSVRPVARQQSITGIVRNDPFTHSQQPHHGSSTSPRVQCDEKDRDDDTPPPTARPVARQQSMTRVAGKQPNVERDAMTLRAAVAQREREQHSATLQVEALAFEETRGCAQQAVESEASAATNNQSQKPQQDVRNTREYVSHQQRGYRQLQGYHNHHRGYHHHLQQRGYGQHHGYQHHPRHVNHHYHSRNQQQHVNHHYHPRNQQQHVNRHYHPRNQLQHSQIQPFHNPESIHDYCVRPFGSEIPLSRVSVHVWNDNLINPKPCRSLKRDCGIHLNWYADGRGCNMKSEIFAETGKWVAKVYNEGGGTPRLSDDAALFRGKRLYTFRDKSGNVNKVTIPLKFPGWIWCFLGEENKRYTLHCFQGSPLWRSQIQDVVPTFLITLCRNEKSPHFIQGFPRGNFTHCSCHAPWNMQQPYATDFWGLKALELTAKPKSGSRSRYLDRTWFWRCRVHSSGRGWSIPSPPKNRREARQFVLHWHQL